MNDLFILRFLVEILRLFKTIEDQQAKKKIIYFM